MKVKKSTKKRIEEMYTALVGGKNVGMPIGDKLDSILLSINRDRKQIIDFKLEIAKLRQEAKDLEALVIRQWNLPDR